MSVRNRILLPASLVTVILVIVLLLPFADDRWRIVPDAPRIREKETYLDTVRHTSMPPDQNDDARVDITRGRNPNIIIILADDLGRTDVSLYGGLVDTPNIDRIGNEGVTFTEATCTTSICAPSRAALLTGRYQQRYGFELQPHDRYARNRVEYLAFRYFINTGHMVPVADHSVPGSVATLDQGLPYSEITLPEFLRARGYRTAAYGKWHLGYTKEFSPLRFGFEEHYGFYEAFSIYAPLTDESIVGTRIDDFSDKHMWSKGRSGASAIVHNDVVVEESEYLTFRFADLAVRYIEDHSSMDGSATDSTPYFLYLPFNAPHTPLQAPERYVERFSHEPDPVKRTYFAMIAALDDAVGKILEALERTGAVDDTMVIFASDNGGASYLGMTHNGMLAGGKFTNFEGGLGVPFMIRYPREIPSGLRYDAAVSLMDIYATVEAVAGGRYEPGERGNDTVPENFGLPERPPGFELDGVDLLPYVLGFRDGIPHEELFYRSIYNHAVRSGDWKLIVTDSDNPDGEHTEMLFDLTIDPSERFDIGDRHPEIRERLSRLLAGWEETLADPLWPPVMHFFLDVWGRRFWFAI